MKATVGERRAILFTDLDGSLLDLHSYSFAAAGAALAEVRARRLPLIFCSSKTRAEQQVYQQAIGIREPFIVENGGAIFIPQNYFSFPIGATTHQDGFVVIEFGVGAQRIRRELQRLKGELCLSFRGYAEMSLAELSQLTGLDAAAAARARQRQYSETLSGALTAEETAKLAAALQQVGLGVTRGSRFLTVAAAQTDKGVAVRQLTALFRRQFGDLLTIAIGDGLNDAPMLAAVELPYLLKQSDGDWAAVDAPNLQRVDGSGAVGWNAVVLALLGVRGSRE